MDDTTEHLIAIIATGRDQPGPTTQSKAGTKRKRASYEHHDIPWTASRCNRLLRTITSRINILQKLAATNRLDARGSVREVERDSDSVEEVSGPGGRAGLVGGRTSPSKDPEWMPAMKSMRDGTAKTYGARAKRKQPDVKSKRTSKHASSTGLGISTPFVKRMLRPLRDASSSDGELSYSSVRSSAPVQERRKARLFPVKPTSIAEEAYNNLISALGSFLLATKPDVSRSRSGAPSMREICLRKVPKYIDLEKDCSNTEDLGESEEADIASELYAELEALGSADQGGWPGLREVVRADGLWRLQVATRNGLLPSRIVDALVDVCTKHEAVREGQALLQEWLKVGGGGRAPALSKLCSFGETSDCSGLVVRILCEMLQCNIVSILELTSQKQLWHAVLESIMRETARPDAVEFMNACMHSACSSSIACSDEPQRALQRVADTFRSMAVLLAAMATSDRTSDGDVNSAGSGLVDAVHRMATNAAFSYGRILNDRTEGEPSAEQARALLSPFLVISLTLRLTGQTPNPSTQHLKEDDYTAYLTADSGSSYGLSQLQNPTDTMISDIALCIARWDPEAGDEYLTQTITQLLGASSTHSKRSAEVANRLALGSAIAYAEARHDVSSRMFAEEIEDVVVHGAQSDLQRTPAVRQKWSSYRWEEGLCEWIARTPFTNKGPGKCDDDSFSADQGISTPHCEHELAVSIPSDVGVPDLKQIPAMPQPQARRPLADIKNVVRSRQIVFPRNKPVKRSHSDVIALEEDVCDRDELALSAKKVKRPQEASCPTAPFGRNKVADAKQRRVGALRRSKSESHALCMPDTSDDELGM